jgi:hypothetical protein
MAVIEMVNAVPYTTRKLCGGVQIEERMNCRLAAVNMTVARLSVKPLMP